MFPSADNRPTDRDSRQDFYQRYWPSVVRMIILEILLLLALSGALVFYLRWSSDAAVSEFMAGAGQTLHAVTDRPICHRNA